MMPANPRDVDQQKKNNYLDVMPPNFSMPYINQEQIPQLSNERPLNSARIKKNLSSFDNTSNPMTSQRDVQGPPFIPTPRDTEL